MLFELYCCCSDIIPGSVSNVFKQCIDFYLNYQCFSKFLFACFRFDLLCSGSNWLFALVRKPAGRRAK